jgi:hypothetical protein
MLAAMHGSPFFFGDVARRRSLPGAETVIRMSHHLAAASAV